MFISYFFHHVLIFFFVCVSVGAAGMVLCVSTFEVRVRVRAGREREFSARSRTPTHLHTYNTHTHTHVGTQVRGDGSEVYAGESFRVSDLGSKGYVLTQKSKGSGHVMA